MTRSYRPNIDTSSLSWCCGVGEIGSFDTAYDSDGWDKEVHNLTKKEFQSFRHSAISKVADIMKDSNYAVFMITLAQFQGRRMHKLITKDLGFRCVTKNRYNANSGNQVSVYIKNNPKYDNKEPVGDMF